MGICQTPMPILLKQIMCERKNDFLLSIECNASGNKLPFSILCAITKLYEKVFAALFSANSCKLDYVSRRIFAVFSSIKYTKI